MKKILSIVAIGALFTSYGFAENYTVKGNVKASSVVKLGATGGTLVSGQEIAEAYAMADFNKEIPLSSSSTMLLDENVNLQTNNKTKAVAMTLVYTTMTNQGANLSGETIGLKCEYDKGSTGTYAEKSTGAAFDLSDIATDTSNHVVGKLKISANNVDYTKVAGNYQGTVVATISSL
jgi:hypothetical protein